jgi:hypothetical protein
MPYQGRVEALATVPTGGAAVSATNAGGATTCTVAAGSYYLTAAGGVSGLLAALQAALNTSRPSGWTVTMSQDGQVTIDCTSEPWALAWTSTDLRDLLGFTADIASTTAAQTGARQVRGAWFPGCPLRLDGHPQMAPEVTDMVTLVSPLGDRVGLVGNVMLRHRNLVWSAVEIGRYREASAAASGLVNASWERFVRDTQHGRGHSWFRPSSKVQIYYLEAGADTLVGADSSSGVGVSGWYFDMPAIEASLTAAPWTGLFRVEIPEVTTSG